MEPITEYLQMRGLSNRTLSVERLSKQAPGQTGRRSQDKGNRRYARENGLDIVAWAFDYYSGNSALWDRPEARPYFTDPELIASWDVLLGAVVDRITRADSATNREMETWLAEHGKVAVTVDGLRSWLEGSAGKEWENAKLDALAADRVWLSCTVVLPLRVTGGGGSLVRPIAIGTPAA